MPEPAKRRATYADLEAVPEHLVAEIIDGELVTHPRPSPRHGATASALGARLSQPFQFGENGPGGWSGGWTSDDTVSAPPFDAISFSLPELWPLDHPLGLNEGPQPLYAGDR